LQPSYDPVSCTLEPDPIFYGGALDNSAVNCNNDLVKFNTATKTWDCTWDVNSKSNWLTTDGTKIVVDTNLAPASKTIYEVYTYYHLWCNCIDSTYTKYGSTGAYFYFQIKTALTSVTSTQFSSTYTFYVGTYGYINFPTFTTVPSSTGNSKSKICSVVDGTTLY
jgi:hypothetical protein